jgi:hypothetical protein
MVNNLNEKHNIILKQYGNNKLSNNEIRYKSFFSFNSIFLKNINNNNNNKYFKNDYSKANFSDFKYIYKDDLFNKINKIK